MEPRQARAANTSPGLLTSLATIFKNGISLIFNRLELAALELSEVRANLLKLMLISALGIIAICFAVGYWTVLLVFISWDALGWRILLIIASLFTVLSAGAFWYVRSMVAQGKLSMSATMAELRNDRDAFL